MLQMPLQNAIISYLKRIDIGVFLTDGECEWYYIHRTLRIYQCHSLCVPHIPQFDPTFHSGSLVFPVLHKLIVDGYMSPPGAEVLGGW